MFVDPDGDDHFDLGFFVGDHGADGVVFGAEAHAGAGVDADAGVDALAGGDEGGADLAALEFATAVRVDC